MTGGQFLRELADRRFLPAEQTVLAVNHAVATTLPVTPDAVHEDAVRARTEVAAFAACYWTLSPTERTDMWTTLSRRSYPDPLAGWLDHLKAGLGVSPALLIDPDEDEIAQALRDLYVLPPRERAIARAAWLAARVHRQEELHAAAVRLRRNHARIADLEPYLILRLTSKTGLQGLVEARAKRTERPRQEVTSSDRPRERRKGARKKKKSLTIQAKIALVVVPLLFVLGVFIEDRKRNRDGTSRPGPTPFHYTPGEIQPVKPKTVPVFTSPQVEQFRRYDANPVGPRPTGYTSWVLLGRPEAGQR